VVPIMKTKLKTAFPLLLCFVVGLCAGIGSLRWHLTQEKKRVAELEEVVLHQEDELRRKDEELHQKQRAIELEREIREVQSRLALDALRQNSAIAEELLKKKRPLR
jgi:hypothetical protein